MTKTYQSFLREYTEEPSQESQEQEQTNSEIQKLEIRKAAIIDEIEELPDESPEKIKKREELLGVETEIEKLKLIAIKGETAKINQKITANNKDIKDLQQTRQELEKQESGTTEETDTTDGTDKKKSEGFTKAYNNTSKVVGNEDNEDDEDSEESRQTQGKTIGLQNSKHKSLADFLSEGMGIESVLDLDYAHGSKTDTEIHIRFTPAGGTNTADIDTDVPIPITDGYIRREDIITYIQKNLSKFITKFPEGTPPEENEQERNSWLAKRVSVVLSDSIKTYDKIYVDKNVVELTVKEDDDNNKSGFPVLIVSLSSVGKQVMKAKLGSKTMSSLADKAMGKIKGFVKNNTNPKGFSKGGGLL